MTIARRSLAALPALVLPLYARAQSQPVEISVQYSIPELFRGLMEEVAQAFMAANPGIRVAMRAPEQATRRSSSATCATPSPASCPTSPFTV
jgi:multiple sugar transport system substrate-binding protein